MTPDRLRIPVRRALLLAAIVGWATAPTRGLHASPPGHPSETSGRPERIGAAIRAHRASITLLPDQGEIVCTDTVTLDAGAGEIRLKLAPIYTIERFEVAGREPAYEFRKGILTFVAPDADSVLELVISYRGHLPSRSEFTGMTASRAVLREEEFLLWGDRELQFVRLSVTVPRHWTVVGPGTKTDGGVSGAERTFRFEERNPLQVIGWLCAGEYTPTEAANTRFPVTVQRYGADSGQAGELGSAADAILSFYDSAFGPYRFPRLEIVEIEDWVGGAGVLAIAGPGYVMMKQTAFTTDDEFNAAGTVLAHEVAHQWWPGAVFCSASESAFLSEGLSEYSSRLYGEHAGRLGMRDSLGTHPLLQPLLSRTAERGGLPLEGNVDLRAEPTQYLKAAYVHHMLRGLTGREAYGDVLREYGSTLRFGWGSVERFMEIAGRRVGEELGWFTEQWIRGRALPSLKIYNVRLEEAGKGWRTTGRLRMLGYERLTSMVPVRVVAGTEHRDTTIRVGLMADGTYRNDLPFSIETSGRPSRVDLDPEGSVLKMAKLPLRLSALRDPADGLLIVGTGVSGSGASLDALARSDSLLLTRYGWSVGIIADTAATLGDIQRRRVVLYGDSASNSVVSSLAGDFPLSMSAGVFSSGGETIVDSTVTLVQIVENRHNPYGLVVWVAPGGDVGGPLLRPLDRSWVLVKGREEIAGGVWETEDPNLSVVLAD